jgi:phosphoribosylaminoimidazolecarboxamide formyltransferase/IMP cyclohydrolase
VKEEKRLPVRRALVSVFDKQGLDRLAGALHAAGVEVVSTGSTAATLEGHGLAVTRVEELTGFPELLDGRVKTLHPKVHAGLLADRARPGHQAELEAAGIAAFDLVVVNLYPFEDTVATPDVDPALAIERIDIGGPAMVRAAAKNHTWVAVVCDPADYPLIETALTNGGTTLPERQALAAKAFARTAAYDSAVATWMTPASPGAPASPGTPASPGAPVTPGTPQPPGQVPGPPVGERSPTRDGGAPDHPQPPHHPQSPRFPDQLTIGGRLHQTLRYGENPHQGAAFYAVEGPEGPWGLGDAAQVAGKELSYNNLLDADAALALAAEHAGRPFATIVKHTNPCGAAFGATLEEAYAGALDGDPVSAFGGVVGLSRPLDAATAKRIAGIFTEVVVAPGFDEEALAVLAGKPSLRLVRVDLARPAGWLAVRSVAGGLLAQEPDPGADDPAGWALQAGDPPGPELLADLALAWSVAGHVKSNAIVLARDGRVVGVGAGQQSRVDSVRIAVAKAGERARGAAAGSDAYFPFPDGVEALAAAGVAAVAQPGGSVRDPEVTAAAAATGITMLHTGRRHFRH